jgi:hypothetical protein
MKRFRIVTLLLAFLLAAPVLLHAQIVKGELILGGNICQVDGDECYHYRKPGVHVGAGALIPITSWMDVGLEVLFNQKGAYKGDSINQHLGLYTGTYKLNLNYAEIPVMIYLTDKDRYSLGVGVSYGRIVGLQEYFNGQSTAIRLGDGQIHWRNEVDGLPDLSQATNIKELTKMLYDAGYPQNAPIEELVPQVIANSDSYRAHDFNICADMRVRIWEGIHAELRYQYSLVPIRTRLFYKDANETLLKTDDSRVQPLQRQYNNSITLRVVYLFNEHRSKANKEASKKGGI